MEGRPTLHSTPAAVISCVLEAPSCSLKGHLTHLEAHKKKTPRSLFLRNNSQLRRREVSASAIRFWELTASVHDSRIGSCGYTINERHRRHFLTIRFCNVRAYARASKIGRNCRITWSVVHVSIMVGYHFFINKPYIFKR